MLVFVTVNSVNKISSITTAYLPGKPFTNEVSIKQSKEVQYIIKIEAKGTFTFTLLIRKGGNHRADILLFFYPAVPRNGNPQVY